MGVPMHTTKAYGKEEVQLHSFLTRVLDGVVGFIPWPLCPRGKDPVVPSEVGAEWTPNSFRLPWRRDVFLVAAGNRATIPDFSNP